MGLLITIILWVVATVVGLAFHELGHYLSAKYHGLNPKFGFDKKGLFVKYQYPNKIQRLNIIVGGVLLGYAPVVLLFFIDGWTTFFWLLAWTMGNVREIKKAVELAREVTENE